MAYENDNEVKEENPLGEEINNVTRVVVRIQCSLVWGGGNCLNQTEYCQLCLVECALFGVVFG